MYKPLIITYICMCKSMEEHSFWETDSSGDVFLYFVILQCSLAVNMELHVENNGKLSHNEGLDK